MANYTAVARTNYFKVTDEEEYQKLFSNLITTIGEDIEDFTEVRDGVTYHGFGSYDSISYRLDCQDDCCECDIGVFLEKIQKILPDNEAFIYFEARYEKLRYVAEYCLIVTKNDIKRITLDDMPIEYVKNLLGEVFETQTVY